MNTSETISEALPLAGDGPTISWEYEGYGYELTCWETPPGGRSRSCYITEGDLKRAGFVTASSLAAAKSAPGIVAALRENPALCEEILNACDPLYRKASERLTAARCRRCGGAGYRIVEAAGHAKIWCDDCYGKGWVAISEVKDSSPPSAPVTIHEPAPAAEVEQATGDRAGPEYTPDNSSHPGDTLREMLKERGVVHRQFAAELGITAGFLCDFLKCRRGAGTQMALRLEKALGLEAEFWLTLQMNHDLATARAAEKPKRKP